MEKFRIINEVKSLLNKNDFVLEEKIDIYNNLTIFLKQFLQLEEPCLAPQLVKAEFVAGNAYNPNTVAPPEMDLLHLSIKEDGVTQPVVVYALNENNYEVVDGFHRRCIIKGEDQDGKCNKKWADIPQRLKGYIPVVKIDKTAENRKASTIRHNRARGKHGVGPMSEIVQELFMAGWSDSRICEHLGMEPDEVLRLKQISGLAELFAEEDFSEAWEPEISQQG